MKLPVFSTDKVAKSMLYRGQIQARTDESR
jgi:hypothetical protein